MQSNLAARKDHASEFFASLNLKVLRAQSPTKLLFMLCMSRKLVGSSAAISDSLLLPSSDLTHDNVLYHNFIFIF